MQNQYIGGTIMGDKSPRKEVKSPKKDIKEKRKAKNEKKAEKGISVKTE